jgi:hypothetical protein
MYFAKFRKKSVELILKIIAAFNHAVKIKHMFPIMKTITNYKI